MNAADAIADREHIPVPANPLGLAGIEFIEYATPRPQALGQVLEAMGYCPVARHRSREVVLYRQGTMNLVVNAHPDDARVSAIEDGAPVISAVGLRVHDAGAAFRRCLALGAWECPSHAQPMELLIPSIHGPGSTRIFFVDRWQDFSIFDIDFVPIPSVNRHPPALAGLRYFGLVQYVGAFRSDDWLSYYQRLLGFVPIPDEERYGIMPKGKLMRSPCGSFLWQLIEPELLDAQERDDRECLHRIGLATPDVARAVHLLRSRGIEFVDTAELHPEDRGALTRPMLGTVAFELVHAD